MWFTRRPVSWCALALAACAPGLPAAAAPPAPEARAYILVETTTGAVLAARNPDAQLPMASTTKIMTALVVVENTELGDRVVVHPSAAGVGESSARLVPGETLTVRDLLTALMVGSGNDAAIALAVHVAGSESAFADLMNRRAAAMGLRRTRFVNAHGLDASGHHSSVRDLVRMGEALMGVAVLRDLAGRREAVIPAPPGGAPRRLVSRNDLLGILPEADGVKTGNTAGAGYSLVASARRPRLGVALAAAQIGAPSEERRARDMDRLLRWGFGRYARPDLVRPGQLYGVLPVRGRPGVRVHMRAEGPALRVPVRVDRPLRETVVAPGEVVGPVVRGQVLGRVTLRQGDRVLGTRTLVAGEDAGPPGVWDRVRALAGAVAP